ncbi:unnamed protein product [Psylliodes chrysocephalus]|uniref:Uncharacterized protein n=1 Tax=Psylliodes chrysocephalus TaxID=3402493 RepID=A0A9P0CW50_9CUCU|nr:unnamed protein product [Psylliodes chrysocephala]
MKMLKFLCLVILFTPIFASLPLKDYGPKLTEVVKHLHDECSILTGVTDTDIDNTRNGNFDEKNIYIMFIPSDDGVPSLHGNKNLFLDIEPPKLKGKFAKMFMRCIDEARESGEKNFTVLAWNATNCLHRTDPEDYKAKTRPDILKFRNKCYTASGVTEKMIDNVRRGVFGKANRMKEYLACLWLVSDVDFGENLAKDSVRWHDSCIVLTDANQEMIDAIIKGDFTEKLEIKKYLACLWLMSGCMDSKFTMDDEKLKYYIPKNLQKEVVSFLKCADEANKKGSDYLTKIWELTKCNYNRDPAKFIMF